MVVEVDVGDHRHPRAQRGDRAVRLVSLDDEPALPRAGVRAELRHLAADDPARVAAGLAEREGDHRRGRRLAVRAGDDDRRRRSDDELREQVGARPARHRRDTRSRRTPPSPRAPPAPATRAPRYPPRGPGRGTASRSGPSRRPPRPRPAPAARTPRARRRRSRRARSAGPQAEASAISSSAISSAASGFAAAPHRLAHRREPRAVGEQLAHDRGHPRRSRLGHDDRAAGLPRSSARSSSGGRAVTFGEGTSTAGLPGGRHLPDRPAGAREHEIGRRRAPRRSRPSTAAAGSRAAVTRPSSSGEVALAAEVEHRRPFRAERRRARSRSAPPRPGCRRRRAAPSPSAGSPNRAPRLRRPEPARRRGTGRPTTRYFAARSAPGTRGRPAARTARRAGSRARGARPPRTALPGSASARPRRPSAPPRIRRRRTRRPASARRGSARTPAARARRAAQPAAARRPGRRGSPEIRNGSNSIARLRDEPRLDPVRRAGEAHAARRGRGALRRRRATASRDRRSRRPRSRTGAASSTPSLRAMLRRIPTDARMTTRLVPP